MRAKVLKFYGVALALAIIYSLVVIVKGSGIPCIYRSATGLLCPGCGATDMLVALSNFRIAQAFFCNPLVFTLLIVWNCVAIAYLIRNRWSKADKRFLIILIILSVVSTIAFTIVRNLY